MFTDSENQGWAPRRVDSNLHMYRPLLDMSHYSQKCFHEDMIFGEMQRVHPHPKLPCCW